MSIQINGTVPNELESLACVFHASPYKFQKSAAATINGTVSASLSEIATPVGGKSAGRMDGTISDPCTENRKAMALDVASSGGLRS